MTGRQVLLNDAWLDRRPPVDPEAPPEPSPGAALDRVGGAGAWPCRTPWLGVEGHPHVRAHAGGAERDAVGAHELLIGGTTAEALRLADLRIADLRRDRRLLGFRVARRSVWQLFAFPFEVAASSPAAWRDEEVRLGERVVDRVPGAVAVLAWAPRVPFELWVMPAAGREWFGAGDPDGVAALVDRWTARLGRALPGTAVDAVVVDGEPWRVELHPRLGRPSLLEGMGLPAHGTFPEAAALYLREVGLLEGG